jgi:hypothetical protein
MIYEGYLVRVKASGRLEEYYYATLSTNYTPSDPRQAHIYRTEAEAKEEVKFRNKWNNLEDGSKWEYKKVTIKIED